VALAMVLGIGLGLVAGYVGGWVDAFIMRVADVQLTFPSILIAMLIDGVGAGVVPPDMRPEPGDLGADLRHRRLVDGCSMPVRARLDAGREEQGICAGRAGDRRRTGDDHVAACAAQRDGAGAGDRDHHLALAIIAEATLSFLGVGVPPTTPSLGTLIRIGKDFLFSGEWWITIFPALRWCCWRWR
jgi:peptide/nickel transport system permease protein